MAIYAIYQEISRLSALYNEKVIIDTKKYWEENNWRYYNEKINCFYWKIW
jgi:hypothetical protein